MNPCLVGALLCMSVGFYVGCGGVEVDPSGEDITHKVLIKTDASCKGYVGSYKSSVTEKTTKTTFAGALKITVEGESCSFTSNLIPNHNFGDVKFANAVAAGNQVFQVPTNPQIASKTTALSLRLDNGIFLNGVKLDLLAAACYGVGGEPLGREKIGCFQPNIPWRYDPMFSENNFGTDSHNAHTQPNGTYHYHGNPRALYDTSGKTASSVIGFAADGFPIYGPYIDDKGTIRQVKSGYLLKSGKRVNQQGEGAFPGGNYDGTFVDDYEWSASNGDLDECNGMTLNGSYGYYVTNSYPWVLNCFKGTPDSSFNKN